MNLWDLRRQEDAGRPDNKCPLLNKWSLLMSGLGMQTSSGPIGAQKSAPLIFGV